MQETMTMTMQEAEDMRRARLAGAWTAFAAGLLTGEAEAGRTQLDVVEGDRVGRRRRPRRDGGYGPVAA